MPEAQMQMRLPQSPREYARALPPVRALDSRRGKVKARRAPYNPQSKK